MAAQTTKAITATTYEAVRTHETGDKHLVILVTYADATQERIVLPLGTVTPA